MSFPVIILPNTPNSDLFFGRVPSPLRLTARAYPFEVASFVGTTTESEGISGNEPAGVPHVSPKSEEVLLDVLTGGGGTCGVCL